MAPQFLGWQRPGVYRLVPAGAPSAPRLTATLQVDLADGGPPVSGRAPFLIAGPGDVAGVAAGRIVQRVPHPGTVDTEVTKAAHIEFSDPDLPWRYSPVGNPPAGTGVIRPWLVLVVGTPQEVVLSGSGLVELRGPRLFDQHPLGDSGQWAHAHDVGGQTLARLVSPRDLERDATGVQVDGLDFVAALVPGWQVRMVNGSLKLLDSWTSGGPPVTLPLYDSWTFRTHPEPGDFASIARALDPLTGEERQRLTERAFGRATIAISTVPGHQQSTGGALSVIPQPGDPPVEGPVEDAVATGVLSLTQERTEDGRWVLTLPRYDSPWHPGPVAGEPYVWPLPGVDVPPPGWRMQLRNQPRYRGAAGLGAWNAIAWQDKISDAAAQQAGAVALAAARIRHLTAGLQAAGSLWRNRMPADPLGRLAILAPALGRIPVAGGDSVLAAVVGRTPWLDRGLFSSAARRMLRRRGPVQRLSASGAASLQALLQAANRCPPGQNVPEGDARTSERLGAEEVAASLPGRLREVFGQLVEGLDVDQRTREELRRAVGEAAAIAEAAGLLARPAPSSDCRPLDLGAFAGSVAAGVDPTGHEPAVLSVALDGVTGLRPPLLAEPDVAPEIDLPLWSFLSDNSRDWLLPGAGDVPPDRVLAVQTNPVFVEAYLIGANYQTLGELRWRNLPITARWTPLRRFWQRVDPVADAVTTDICPVTDLASDAQIWTDASDLGDGSHATAGQAASLVIVLHTTLFRRYPATLIYLVPNDGGANAWQNTPPLASAAERPRHFPIFSGRLTPDLVFFGFDLPPAAIGNHWVVLEEPPRGFRFYHPAHLPPGKPPPPAADDAAQYASKTFAEPVRVFLGNLQ
jgi:hypothetical protein